MYPPNINQCLKQLKTFNPSKKELVEDESSLPALPHPLQTAMEYEAQFEHWETKFAQECSSQSRLKWEAFVEGMKEVLICSQLQEYELWFHQNK